jgi:hypothetical protein
MAKILFTWEIGRGSGHIAPYINLINQLEQQGHSIYFAARELDNASRLFASTQVTWIQSPQAVSHKATRKNRFSYVESLQGLGYERADELSSLIRAWINLFTLVGPDLIIFDYSPTAILASKGYRPTAPAGRPGTLRIGTGFHSPPAVSPIPDFRAVLGVNQDPVELVENEQKLLKLINQALTDNAIAAIDQVADMQLTDQHIFRTFKELDHYPTREKAVYGGIFQSPAGKLPQWPEFPGAKVFFYTKPFPALRSFLQALSNRKYPMLVYGDGLPADLKRHCESETLHFTDTPLDMNAVSTTADLAICNANHGASSELLINGTPILMLPRNAEQHLVAHNVETLGAGLIAPVNDARQCLVKFDQMLASDRYRQGAQRFARQYQDFDGSLLLQRVLTLIRDMLQIAA